MTQEIIRILFMPRESFPTDRVRINVLFGRELLDRGHEIDLVMQAADERFGQEPMTGSGVNCGSGRPTAEMGFCIGLRKHWLAVRHDLRSLHLATTCGLRSRPGQRQIPGRGDRSPVTAAPQDEVPVLADVSYPGNAPPDCARRNGPISHPGVDPRSAVGLALVQVDTRLAAIMSSCRAIG